MSKATVMAVVNQKGGTGKTTTCENLGIGLAQEGKRVLLVDTDPQASLTIALGHPRPDEIPITLTDLMAKVKTAERKVHLTFEKQDVPVGEPTGRGNRFTGAVVSGTIHGQVSVYNLKQMSKTLLFLRDHKIESLEQLNRLAAQKISERDDLLASVQQSERRLAEIGTLKKHIINYSKTRPIYEEYRKAGYSKKFLEAHREEITIHKAAKAAFDALGVKKLPKVKELSIEYAEILDAKKRTYTEYRRTKNEAQELLLAQRNIASLYDAERKKKEPGLRKEEQSH